MSVVNMNISGLIGLNNLRLTNLGLKVSLERLSSGQKINKAADDPSGLAISMGMAAQIGGIRMAMQNAEDGINLIHTADGALAETQDMLMRMRDLAVRAANEATLTSADISRINKEFRTLSDEIYRKENTVTFNTKHLFRGEVAGFTEYGHQMLQVGPDNGSQYIISIYIPHVCTGAWGIPLGADAFATAGSACVAISSVQHGIDETSDLRATLGVQERRLNHVIDDLKAEDINISAAKSRIYDADMAVEISEFTRLQILQQTGTAILAQANAQPQSVLQLLR